MHTQSNLSKIVVNCNLSKHFTHHGSTQCLENGYLNETVRKRSLSILEAVPVPKARLGATVSIAKSNELLHHIKFVTCNITVTHLYTDLGWSRVSLTNFHSRFELH